ncbi:MAG TPA: thioredoxin-like domain-containing protein [Rhodanobacteraceae bacterium]|nr:thioredoxin-like domain-containing protein [Rhodanobacteraceae bacterium]
MKSRTITVKRFLLVLVATVVVVAGVLSGTRGARAQAAVPFPTDLPWFNVSRPLTLDDLKGRAVLLDFFTPGCINCVHMLPDEQRLEQHFGKRLVIIGIDSPKFTASSTRAGLESFITRYQLRHPIVLDPKSSLWNAYGVQAWPTLVLIGPDGRVRNRWIGEQTYEQLAGPIAAAVADAPPASSLKPLPLRAMRMPHGVLATPAGIAVSATQVAIADTGHNRIVLTDRNGKVETVIGSGCAGRADGDHAHAEFNRPHGLAFHGGALYVADTDNQLIRRIDLATHEVSTVAGDGERAYRNQGESAALAATLNSPWDVAWSGDKLYVSMAGDHQIWRYDPAAKTIGPWAGTGAEGLQDGGRDEAQFAQPSGLSTHDGTLYDVDPESSSVRAITLPGGEVKTLVGRGLFDFGMQNGGAGDALLQHAEGIAWNAGNLYIADTFNNALRRLYLRTGQLSTVASGLHRPLAVAVRSPDTLLVAEGDSNRIDAVHLPDGKVTPWPIAGLKAPDTKSCPPQ